MSKTMVRGTFTIDTCVIFMICDDPYREEFAKCLRIGNDFADATILLNPMIVEEMTRRKLDRDSVKKMLSDALGTRVRIKNVTDDVSKAAKDMADRYPKLHPGDDEILAYAVKYNSALITCDKDFETVARQVGIQVTNPDTANAERLHYLEQRRARRHPDASPRKMSATQQVRAWMGRQQHIRTARDTSQQDTARKVLELQRRDEKSRQRKQKKIDRTRQRRRDHQRQLDKLARQSPSGQNS